MYPSDLTDEQWNAIKEYVKRSDPRGAVPKYSKRNLINGIFYIIRTGAQWRMLPKDMPPWTSVYDHYRRLRDRGVWDQIMFDLNKKFRISLDKNAHPSYAIIDAQSIKTQYSGEKRGYDGGKKNKGTKKTRMRRYDG